MAESTEVNRQALLRATADYCAAHAEMLEVEAGYLHVGSMQYRLRYGEISEVVAKRAARVKKLLPEGWSMGEAILYLLKIVKETYEASHAD